MPPPADSPRPLSPAEARELALVEAIRRGDSSAWTELLTRYQHRLFTICARMTGDRDMAADLTQEAMVKIIEGIGKYDGRARLSTWIIRVTMNVVLSRLRSEKHRRHASLDAPPRGHAGRLPEFSDSSTGELSGRASVEQREERQLLGAALLRMDDEQRGLLLLRDVHGLEYEQIAEVLGVPVGTVKSRLFRAREALRREVESGASGAPQRGRTGA